MIAHVEGTVAAVRLDSAVLSVGGVGLLVHATPDSLAGLRPGQRAWLATSLVVREDSLTLFGFADDDSRDTFELLQTVSGIGPRLAMAILAVHRPERLRTLVAAADVTALTKVPGIGRKGAQRILLELADRLGAPTRADEVAAATSGQAAQVADRANGPATVVHHVVTALVGLGWPQARAEEAVAAVAVTPGDGDDAPGAGGPGAPEGAEDASHLLRAALRHLGRS